MEYCTLVIIGALATAQLCPVPKTCRPGDAGNKMLCNSLPRVPCESLTQPSYLCTKADRSTYEWSEFKK